MAEETQAPMERIGWYTQDERGDLNYIGPGYRYFDGSEWTETSPPAMQPPPPPVQIPPLSAFATAGAVFIGGLAVWAAVFGLAQADPDSFYWPVKFVVEDLPRGL